VESTYTGDSARIVTIFVALGADVAKRIPLRRSADGCGDYAPRVIQTLVDDEAAKIDYHTEAPRFVPYTGALSQLPENRTVHEQQWEQLGRLDRMETAGRARCRYLPECDSLAIFLLNREYSVDAAQRTIRSIPNGPDARSAGYLEQLCILAYLVNARDLPPAGKLVGVEGLDPGGFFFRGSHRLPVEKLTDAFGSDPALLHKAGQGLNVVSQAFGDAAIELSVLPRISLIVIIWAADDEFAARASILFDQSASVQLPLDALFAVATLTINTIVSSAKTVV